MRAEKLASNSHWEKKAKYLMNLYNGWKDNQLNRQYWEIVANCQSIRLQMPTDPFVFSFIIINFNSIEMNSSNLMSSFFYSLFFYNDK